MDLALLLIGFLIGLISGIISGAFGIGASSIKIVLLRVLLGIPASVAIATALPLSIPAALSGTAVYTKHRLLKYKTTLVCGVSGAAFSVLGAFATRYVEDHVLMLLLGTMLLLFSVLIFNGRGKQRDGAKACQTLQEKAGYSIVIGAIAGFASGFLGIGGGVIIVPLLSKLRKISYKQAIPCSLAIMLMYVVPASATHFALGHVDLQLFVSLFAGTVVGAWIGARNIVEMSERQIRKWFALTLAIFGIILLLHEFGIIRMLLQN